MNFARGFLLGAGAAALACMAPLPVHAAGTLQSAEVTRVYNDVRLLSPDAPSEAAKIGDEITGATAVQTGGQSRAELQFNDQTLARLGANSIFSFNRGTRDLNLNEGVILLEVPKNAGGATINTAAVTAAVTGTTVMIEYRKGKKPSQSVMKFIVLEGTMRLKLKGRSGESELLSAGQIVTIRGNVNRLPDPQFIDVERLTKTSGLMSKQFSPLKNDPYIFKTASEQKVLKSKGKLLVLNYGLYGKRKNPILQAVGMNNQTSLRTSAEVPNPKPRASKPVSRPKPHVNRPSPRPPKPPVNKRPKPPKQPPRPKPPKPVPPPPVPPPPVVPS